MKRLLTQNMCTQSMLLGSTAGAHAPHVQAAQRLCRNFPTLKTGPFISPSVANSSLTGQERENLSARPAFLLSVEEYTATRFPLTLFLV